MEENSVNILLNISLCVKREKAQSESEQINDKIHRMIPQNHKRHSDCEASSHSYTQFQVEPGLPTDEDLISL